MINRIGQTMGLKMNEIRLVIAKGQIRFLSKYFLKKDERLIHGAEICGEHLGDKEMAIEIANNKITSRDLFTFEFIKAAVETVFPQAHDNLMRDLIKMIVFDAVTGNNDRHFYNWGVIDSKKKTDKMPTFAPLYDSSRGLFWNHNDNYLRAKFANQQGGKEIDKYIRKGCPRISTELNKGATHFELIEFIKLHYPIYTPIIDELSSELTENKVINMIKREFYPFFIRERGFYITLILNKRFTKIREVSYAKTF